jgi:hypothetical protein
MDESGAAEAAPPVQEVTMQYAKWIVGAASILVLVEAFAQYPQSREPTMEDFERAAAKAQQLMAEEQKFDAQHAFKGQPAGGAMHRLQVEGYQCKFGSLQLSRLAKGTSVTIELFAAPVIVCLQRAKDESDICAARRVTLVPDWDGKDPPPQPSPELVTARTIAEHGFRCIQKGEPVPQ